MARLRQEGVTATVRDSPLRRCRAQEEVADALMSQVGLFGSSGAAPERALPPSGRGTSDGQQHVLDLLASSKDPTDVRNVLLVITGMTSKRGGCGHEGARTWASTVLGAAVEKVPELLHLFLHMSSSFSCAGDVSPSLLITTEARTSFDDATPAGAARSVHLASSFFGDRQAGSPRHNFKRGLDFDAVQDHEQLSTIVSTADFMRASRTDPAPAVLSEVCDLCARCVPA